MRTSPVAPGVGAVAGGVWCSPWVSPPAVAGAGVGVAGCAAGWLGHASQGGVCGGPQFAGLVAPGSGSSWTDATDKPCREGEQAIRVRIIVDSVREHEERTTGARTGPRTRFSSVQRAALLRLLS